MNKQTAITNIVEAMTTNGFMSGYFGDDSAEFKSEQVDEIAELDVVKLHDWLSDNAHNIVNYCGCRTEWDYLMENPRD